MNDITTTVQEINEVAVQNVEKTQNIIQIAEQSEQISQDGQRDVVAATEEIEHLRQQVGLIATKILDLTERTQQLTEALEYQAATSEVLSVISRSTFDLQPVLDTIASVATRLCAANDATILLKEDEALRVSAHHGSIPQDLNIKLPIDRGWVSGRAVVDRQPIQAHDIAAALDEFPLSREIVGRFGLRTVLSIPLLREDEAKVVLAASIGTALRSAPAAPAWRPRDRVAFDELLIAGQNVVPDAAARRSVEARLPHPIERDGNLPALLDVLDVALLGPIAHGAADEGLGAAQEALAVGEALAARIEASVNDVHAPLA